MKAPQFYITVVLSAICLVLSIVAMHLGQTSQDLQTKVQAQQLEVNRGLAARQTLQKLVNDMAPVSLKNEKIKQVLARNGLTVSTPTPSPSPAGAAVASPSPVAATSAPASSTVSGSTTTPSPAK